MACSNHSKHSLATPASSKKPVTPHPPPGCPLWHADAGKLPLPAPRTIAPEKAPSFAEYTKSMKAAVAKLTVAASSAAKQFVQGKDKATPTYALGMPLFDCAEFDSAKHLISATLQQGMTEMFNHAAAAEMKQAFHPAQFEVQELACSAAADADRDAGLAAVFKVHVQTDEQMGALMLASVSGSTATDYFGQTQGHNAWTTRYGPTLAMNDYILVN